MPRAQQLGRYHLLDRIAYGGMAEIFRAKTFDAEGQVHMVAIKRLLPHLGLDEEFLAMLVDEAKLSAHLQHPNIARVYEFGHAGDSYYLAMEYIEGKDLRALLERARSRRVPLGLEHAVWIAIEAATALHAAHTLCDPHGAALRIVHRDVSPSNILLSYRGDVKLCDFGIAKATLSRVHTKTGVVKGKVKYMSPEQAMGRPLDHRSDLFSLGSVLYEMLTLTAPFQAANEVDLIFAVRDARCRPLRDLRPDCPPALAHIVEHAMLRVRTDRYPSGEQLARDLRNFLDTYRPGYGRSHLSGYLQQQFAAEIDYERRRLQSYTIDHIDESLLGENLLADVLGPDAAFTHFTPARHRLPRSPGEPADRPAISRPLARPPQRLRPGTVVLPPSPARAAPPHASRTAEGAQDRTPPYPPLDDPAPLDADADEPVTSVYRRPLWAPEPDAPIALMDEDADTERIFLGAEGSLPTRLNQAPAPPSEPAPPPAPPRTSAPHPSTRPPVPSPEREPKSDFAESPSEDEATIVRLGDEDLEPV
ncbi:MAG TPA: serine/threonine-protein kinase [Polyangia bacterium]|jgi:serine/threonine-protein kinase|nr:serine/threonine-protein kinase [Polyangia bacterium]